MPPLADILLVEDDEKLNALIVNFLTKHGFQVHSFVSGDKAVNCLKNLSFAAAVLDIHLGNKNGFEILRLIKSLKPACICIMITAFADINSAVKAIKEGAHEYLVKPFKEDVLINCLKNALRAVELENENRLLKNQIMSFSVYEQIIGESPEMKRIRSLINDISHIDVNIFISGETGTGKEIVARSIHKNSKRGLYHFVPINCASIPESLLESELFGHIKGAFTGAVADRKGKFEIAQNGTVFLDEITEMPYNLQAKFLRVIQEKEFEPIGSNKTVKIDVRFISASNKKVEELIAGGIFREDLFYRLSIYPVKLPPLREHIEDIPLLIKHISRKYNYPGLSVSKACLKKMMEYSWPGNIRELENALHFAVVNAKSTNLDLIHFPEKIQTFSGEILAVKPAVPASMSLVEQERRIILDALKSAGGNQTKAADRLGITRSALIYKMKKMNIKSSHLFE